ncbi:MAG: hypothetical protein AB9869_36200 [Verrucomicrobiia bacterium]
MPRRRGSKAVGIGTENARSSIIRAWEKGHRTKYWMKMRHEIASFDRDLDKFKDITRFEPKG